MKNSNKKFSEQAGVTNVLNCYRDHANPVQCKRGLSSYSTQRSTEHTIVRIYTVEVKCAGPLCQLSTNC